MSSIKTTRRQNRTDMWYQTIQGGSTTGSLSGNYKSFPTAFGAAPIVVLTPKTNDVTKMAALSRAAGSFSAYSSPTGKILFYLAYGSIA